MRTEISKLGEFGLIRRLTEGIEPQNPSTNYGVGDDAAVLSYPAEKEILVTTDLLLEGVHFNVGLPFADLFFLEIVGNGIVPAESLAVLIVEHIPEDLALVGLKKIEDVVASAAGEIQKSAFQGLVHTALHKKFLGFKERHRNVGEILSERTNAALMLVNSMVNENLIHPCHLFCKR